MRSRSLRIVVGVVGLALAVYGVASVTGGWLGTPPWWEQIDVSRVLIQEEDWVLGQPEPANPTAYRLAKVEPRRGREWISGGVVAVGLALVAFAAWPRRKKPRNA